MTPPEDAGALEVLDIDECWALARSKAIGRIAANRTGMGPLVVPVNYVIDADLSVVFRSGEGTKLDATERGILTLQVDDFDHLHHTGWSVLIEGLARWVYDVADDTPVDTWAPGDHPYLVRLHPHLVTGRRIRLVQPDTDGRGYR